MKTRLLGMTLSVLFTGGVFAADTEREATFADEKKYNTLKENMQFEEILEKVMKSPDAIIDKSDDENGNIKNSQLVIDIDGTDPKTKESCTVTLKKKKTVAEPMTHFEPKGIINVDWVSIIFPSFVTKLNYTVQISNSTYTKKHGRLLGAQYDPTQLKNRGDGVELYKSETTPGFLGNREISKISFRNESSLLVESEVKPFWGFEGKYHQKVTPAFASCVVSL